MWILFLPLLKQLPSDPHLQFGDHVLDFVRACTPLPPTDLSPLAEECSVTCAKGGFYNLTDNPAPTLGTFGNVGWHLFICHQAWKLVSGDRAFWIDELSRSKCLYNALLRDPDCCLAGQQFGLGKVGNAQRKRW